MTKKYIDLKESYDAKTLQFWSNSAGDLHSSNFSLTSSMYDSSKR